MRTKLAALFSLFLFLFPLSVLAAPNDGGCRILREYYTWALPKYLGCWYHPGFKTYLSYKKVDDFHCGPRGPIGTVCTRHQEFSKACGGCQMGGSDCFCGCIGCDRDANPHGKGSCIPEPKCGTTCLCLDGTNRCWAYFCNDPPGCACGGPGPKPTPPPPVCLCDNPWEDAGCGGWECLSNEMHQVQFCFWSDGSGHCQTNNRCVESPLCWSKAWWQTQGGDVHSQGSLDDPIPLMRLRVRHNELITSGPFCSVQGKGGFSGVITYGEKADFGDGEPSPEGWLAKSTAPSSKDFQYFSLLLRNFDSPDFFSLDEDLELKESFPNRKVIFLVDGQVDIKKNILVSLGDFLMIVASGDINVAPSVDEIQGVFLTDNQFSSGFGNKPLRAEGIFQAQSFNLGRDLGKDNRTTPAEFFKYRPDFWLNAPQVLWSLSFTWEEVAP